MATHVTVPLSLSIPMADGSEYKTNAYSGFRNLVQIDMEWKLDMSTTVKIIIVFRTCLVSLIVGESKFESLLEVI